MSNKSAPHNQQQQHHQHGQQHQHHDHHQQQHSQQQHHHHQPHHQDHTHVDDTKRNTERNRRISQYSKDVHNMGHSHYSHAHSHSDKDSHKTKHEGSDSTPKPERHRKISHHSRDGGAKGHHHTGRPRAGSKREHDRHSVATSGDLHFPVEYENTYKLEPDSIFKPAVVTDIIKQVFHENLSGKKYINGMMGDTCVSLSDIIKERVRQLNLHRFKIVSEVLIGQRKNQSMQVSSRCLWNQGQDNYASFVYNSANLCAVGMVFAVYQE